MQLKPTVLSLDKTFYGPCPVDRTPINKKARCRRVYHQTPHRFKEARCRQLALGKYDTQLTPRIRRKRHVDTEAGVGAEYGRRVNVRHPKKDLPIGTARAIAKLAGWM